jgi:hypothetical protein
LQYYYYVNTRIGTAVGIGAALLTVLVGPLAANVQAQSSGTVPTIRTVAGRIGFGDGGPATDASLPDIKSVAVDNVGRTLIATKYDNRIRRIELDGSINVIAGDGRITQDIPIVGVLATSVALPRITTLLGLADGSVLIAAGQSVLRLRSDGFLEAFANSLRSSTSTCSPTSSQPPSTTLEACYVGSLAVDPAGTVYLGSSGDIQAVSPGGLVTRIAGNGTFSSAPSGEGLPADSVAVGPEGIAYVNGALYFADSVANPFTNPTARPSLRKIGPDGILRTVISSTVVPSAPGVDPRELNPSRVLGSTASGDVLFYNGFGVARYRTDGTVQTFLARFFRLADPAAGGLATNAFFGYRLALAGAPDGSVIVGESETNEVYRIDTNGLTSRVAGRLLSEVEPVDRVSLALARDISQTANGDTLIVEATAANRVWRLTGGYLHLVVGPIRPTAAGASVAPTRRLFPDITRVVEACGSTYFMNGGSLDRVDPSGIMSRVTGPGGSALSGVATIGGGCGALFAIRYDANFLPGIYRIGPDDQATYFRDAYTYVQPPRIGPDGEGGFYQTTSGDLRRYSPTGQATIWSPLPVQHAALIPGGLFLTRPAITGQFELEPNRFSLATFRSGVLTTIREAPPEFEAIGTPIDGPLADVPIVISHVATNPYPTSRIRVMDRGVLREITLPAIRLDAPSVGSNPPAPRIAAGSGVSVPVRARESAPQAG